MGTSRLSVKSLSKEYDSPIGRLRILRDISFEVSPGESIAIVGPSGSGKSTLLNIIGSLDTPTSGSITLDGQEITTLPPDGLTPYRRLKVGFVFQDHHLLPQCTALENVLLPVLPVGYTAEAGEKAAALLTRLGLASRMGFFPSHLSGGERQRVAIARALINGPALLLCDEPTGNMDSAGAREIVKIFIEQAREADVMVIMVTHNLELAGCFTRRLELKDGSLASV